MTAINWPLLILTDSPEFPRKLTIAGMVKMCGNEAKVTNKRFDGNWGNLYTRDLPHSNAFLLSEYHLFYLEANLMPYGFLLYNYYQLCFSSEEYLFKFRKLRCLSMVSIKPITTTTMTNFESKQSD